MNDVEPGSVPSVKAQSPDAVLRYAARPDALVDLHLPPGDVPRPLVVLVHGGFWRQEYDRIHLRPTARALVAAGFAVASVEYRRVGGGAHEAGAGGGWPATAEDVEAAVTALPGFLDGLGIRITSTTLAGHSAGGHLALWLATRLAPAASVDRVVALAPVADLRAAAADRLGDGAAQAFLGGEPDEVPEHYAVADPMTRLDAAAAAKVVLVHGTADDVVPVSQSRDLAAAHPGVTLHELAGVDHMGVIDPGSVAWPAVLAALSGPVAGLAAN